MISSRRKQFFFGTEEVKVWEPRFEYEPSGLPSPGDWFVKYADDGLCEVNPSQVLASASPWTLMKGADAQCTAISLKKLEIKVAGENAFATAIGALKSESDRSFFYRVPGTANVSVLADGKGISQKNLPVAQFGTVASLPATTGGSRNKYDIELSTDTGALLSFKVSADPLLSASQMEGLGTAANSVVDANVAAAKAKQDADKAASHAELEKLKYEKDLLTTKCEVNKLKGVEDPTIKCPTSN
jgi:hypothetical protein